MKRLTAQQRQHTYSVTAAEETAEAAAPRITWHKGSSLEIGVMASSSPAALVTFPATERGGAAALLALSLCVYVSAARGREGGGGGYWISMPIDVCGGLTAGGCLEATSNRSGCHCHGGR